MPAVTMNGYNMTKFSRFAVELFFISFEPSASSIFVAAPDHRPSCVSQRTWAVLYVNVQTSAVVDLGFLSDSVPLLWTRCVNGVVYVRLIDVRDNSTGDLYTLYTATNR